LSEKRQDVAQRGMTGPPGRRQEQRGGRRQQARRRLVVVSERDRELLELVEEQYAITLPQLARLIGRTHETARALRDRWKRAGWIDSGKLAVDAPPFVWLTKRAPIEPSFRTWEPRPGLALHIAAITDVRILLERELRRGRWECERAIAQRFAYQGRRGRDHLPDALLHTRAGTVAIEVELTLKSRERVAAIILELAREYEHVWYFAPATLASKLARIAAETPWGNVHVQTQPPSALDFLATAPLTARGAAALVDDDGARAENPAKGDVDFPMEWGA